MGGGIYKGLRVIGLTLRAQNFSRLLFFLFTSLEDCKNSSRDCFKSPWSPDRTGGGGGGGGGREEV